MRRPLTALLLAIAAAMPAGVAGQGLVERWAWPEESGNLVANGDFEQVGTDGKPLLWSWNTAAWSLTDVAGGKALLLTDSHVQPYYSIAETRVPVTAGYYTLTGDVTTANVTTGSGRLQVLARTPADGPGAAGTNIPGPSLQGTSTARMFPLAAGEVSVQAYGYGKPDGRITFDRVRLARHVPPRDEAFLLYPNFHGWLWTDGPPDIRVAVRGQGPGQLALRAGDGTVVRTVPVQLEDGWQSVTIPAASLPLGPYRLRLETTGGNDQPEYAITKAARSARVRVDPDLVWVQPDAAGTPTRRGLPVLVYHTSGYPADVAGWRALLAPFDALKYDVYLNYWMGQAPVSSMLALGQALVQTGRGYIDTINDFYVLGPDTTAGANHYPTGPTAAPDVARTVPRVSGLNGQPGIAGVYVADELPAAGFWGVWAQRKLVRDAAPALVSFGTQGNMTATRLRLELPLARDLLDVMSVDPYPVRGNNVNDGGSDAEGTLHKLEEVADFTAAAVAAVQDSRPVWATIQFWGSQDRAARGFRWPTEAELRDMSYLAVCAGARGLAYWSLGAKALAYITDPAVRARRLQELTDVVAELKALDPVLAGEAVPLPAALAAGLIGVARRSGTTVTTIACNRTAGTVDGLRPYGQRVTTTTVTPPPAPQITVIDGTDAAGRGYRVTIEAR